MTQAETSEVVAGALYVVATPIGNLGDLSPRAQRVLAQVELVAAEDTRTSGALLEHFGIRAKFFALHDHNEDGAASALLARLKAGASVALVSDAGTPLISDPGYALVRQARAAGVPVFAVPGPSALIAALSVAGLPTDRFSFRGFLPPKREARRQALEALAREPATVVLYESSHRIAETLDDIAAVLGAARPLFVARELTKKFEDSHAGSAESARAWLAADANRSRGEFVLVLGGAPETQASDADSERLLRLLLEELPPARAAKLAAAWSGRPKPALYELAMALKKT